jgi:6-phosphogluconolactonase
VDEVVVCRDLEDLNHKAATEFARLAIQSAATCGRFATALSGGSTPKGLYSLLAASEFRGKIPWSQVHIFWGDERCVGPDHPESNYRMAQETLLSGVPLPAENIHRMRGEKNPPDAAEGYEQTVQNFFQLSSRGPPRFDLIYLGLGEDGHIASLFPGSEALKETTRLVVAVYVQKLKSHRLTLTLPVLNHAANIFFIVAGRDKAPVLKAALQGEQDPERLPAQLIKPVSGKLVWFVDQAAASSL